MNAKQQFTCIALTSVLLQCGHIESNSTSPNKEGVSTYGNPPYYTVNGKRYHTLRSSNGYQATGIASWYGPGFHGSPTASGERYNQHELTAAHRTLPIPSFVEVTRLDNQRKVVVRVNDRGPFHDDRIIDLSYAAAKQLDMVQNGTAQVKIKAIHSQNSQHLTYIQIGSFLQEQSAKDFVATLALKNALPLRIVKNNQNYRVLVGPYTDNTDIERSIEKLKAKGIHDWVFVSSS